ncbi:hypothetical protein Lbir_2191 [Legionella birminghamensis]|uniref:Uncharacterized protein n=1 Tax=Legionella birminghamensis TaxID=28083 RepID=A0A378JQH2_9GAMM|nr:hypothetical protein [Legionella birminghamensis]KTC68997.1 hypothetical protein Lbir_2191 [Legionella birminghamensis]STX60895.1 Uncharacterised protein [Legionella birminghamensis]STX61001.1 Uncharacterised protein [Legionella birminghamensis]
MKAIQINIPADIHFSQLTCKRLPTSNLLFNWEPIEALCKANNMDIGFFKETNEENVVDLIWDWYFQCRNDGVIDSTMEEMINEVATEEQRGQAFSFPTATS